jgi:hypothetical protein
MRVKNEWLPLSKSRQEPPNSSFCLFFITKYKRKNFVFIPILEYAIIKAVCLKI